MWQRLVKASGRKLGIDTQYFITSGFWSALTDVAQAVVGALLAIIFARLATPTIFGQFQLVISLIAVLAVCSLKGLDVVILRDVAKGLEGVYNKALRLRWRWSWLALPLTAALAGYYWRTGQGAVASVLVLVSPVLPLYFWLLSWQAFYRGRQQFDTVTRYVTIRSLLVLGLVVAALWLARDNLLVIVVAYLAAYLVVHARAQWRSWHEAANDDVSEDWRSYGFFLTKTGLFKLVVAHIDKLLVGTFFSPAALAVYAIGTLIPNSVLLLIKSILQTTAPRLAERDHVTFRELRYAFWVGVAFWLLAVATIWLLLVLLFGEQYREALPLAYLASLGIVLQPVTLLLLHFVQTTARRRAVLLTNTIGPFIRVVLIAALGSAWGITGFAAVYGLMGVVWLVVLLTTLRVDWIRRQVA